MTALRDRPQQPPAVQSVSHLQEAIELGLPHQEDVAVPVLHWDDLTGRD
jgi:hypothetical protein